MERYFAGFCRIGEFGGPEAGGGLGWNGSRGMYAGKLRGWAGFPMGWFIFGMARPDGIQVYLIGFRAEAGLPTALPLRTRPAPEGGRGFRAVL